MSIATHYEVTNTRVAECLYGYIMAAQERATGTPVAIKVFERRLVDSHASRTGLPLVEDFNRELELLNAVTAQPHPYLLGMYQSKAAARVGAAASGGVAAGATTPRAALSRGVASGSITAATASSRIVPGPATAGAGPMIVGADTTCAVLPWCDRGDYMAYLMAGTTPDGDQVRNHFAGVASAVRHLHKMGFCHRDVSLENVMLVSTDKSSLAGVGASGSGAGRPSFVAVLGDYGAASELGYHAAPKIRPGKPGYTAPEVFAYGAYDGEALDVYSLGVCLFCMLAGCMPYTEPSRSDACFAARCRDGIPALVSAWGLNDRFKGGALDLVCRMMALRPQDRPTMEEVLAHPYCAAAVAAVERDVAAVAAAQAREAASAVAPEADTAVTAAKADGRPDVAMMEAEDTRGAASPDEDDDDVEAVDSDSDSDDAGSESDDDAAMGRDCDPLSEAAPSEGCGSGSGRGAGASSDACDSVVTVRIGA